MIKPNYRLSKPKPGKVYNNGVRRELVVNPAHGLDLQVLQAVRNGNGSWSVTISIAVTVYLPDGRRIPINRRISLNARQVGRRPYPESVKKRGRR